MSASSLFWRMEDIWHRLRAHEDSQEFCRLVPEVSAAMPHRSTLEKSFAFLEFVLTSVFELDR